jgi:hypothetical protein
MAGKVGEVAQLKDGFGFTLMDDTKPNLMRPTISYGTLEDVKYARKQLEELLADAVSVTGPP